MGSGGIAGVVLAVLVCLSCSISWCLTYRRRKLPVAPVEACEQCGSGGKRTSLTSRLAPCCGCCPSVLAAAARRRKSGEDQDKARQSPRGISATVTARDIAAELGDTAAIGDQTDGDEDSQHEGGGTEQPQAEAATLESPPRACPSPIEDLLRDPMFQSSAHLANSAS
jgi:hypothetical protein